MDEEQLELCTNIALQQSFSSLLFVPALHHSHSPAVTKETILDKVGGDAPRTTQLYFTQNSCTWIKIAKGSAVFLGQILQWFQKKKILKHFHQLTFTAMKPSEMPLSSTVWAKYSIMAGWKALESFNPASRPDCCLMSDFFCKDRTCVTESFSVALKRKKTRTTLSKDSTFLRALETEIPLPWLSAQEWRCHMYLQCIRMKKWVMI